MTLLDTLLWYGDNILYYAGEMLPCMLLALAVFCVLLSPRHRRLAARGLVSSPWREGGLLLFVMFCAGLAALTVFSRRLLEPRPLAERPAGRDVALPARGLGDSAADPPADPLSGDLAGLPGPLGDVPHAGQHRDLLSGGLFSRPAVAGLAVVEGPAGRTFDLLRD